MINKTNATSPPKISVLKKTPWVFFSWIAAFLLGTASAWAQFGAGSGPMRPGEEREEKKDRPKVVEAAEEVEDKGPKPIPPKEWGKRRPMQFLEMDGYFRFRTTMFYKPHLDLRQTGSSPHPPYLNNPAYEGTRHLKNQKMFWSSNMRLRLEPILNVHNTVRVHMTMDVFDNMVMGTTPSGFAFGPQDHRLPFFSYTQTIPERGTNTVRDTLRIKHAWAEVMTPLGQIKAGRMPSHWGLGMFHNSGRCREASMWSVDPDHNASYCLDSDYGNIVDRVMFSSRIPGIDLTVAIGYDFAARGPDTSITDEFSKTSSGQPVDLFGSDDVHQAVLAIGRIDEPSVVRERLAQGKIVFNYGFYGMFRRQKSDLSLNTDFDPNASAGYYASNLVRRDAWALIPDLWFRLNWKSLSVEFEGALVGGKINNLADAGRQESLSLIQWGFVLRSQYKFLNDDLVLRVEVGSASGDENVAAADGTAGYGRISPLPLNRHDKYNTLFAFDPSYYVDLIFFRELMGTVHNATYYKPTLMYNISPHLGVRADAIFSMANEPLATPGQKRWYGIELDADVEYRNLPHGFIVGLSYGVFFPLGAMNFPRSLYGTYQNAKTAQALRFRLSVKF